MNKSIEELELQRILDDSSSLHEEFKPHDEHTSEPDDGQYIDPFLEWKSVDYTGSISARHAHSAVVYNNCLWVFGGDGKDNKRIDQVHFFRVSSLSWHTVRPSGDNNAKPECRSGHSAVLYQDGMVIFGGRNGRSHFADLYLFSFTEKRWKKLKTTGSLVKRRYRHSAVVFESKMYIFGGEVVGENSTYFSDFYELDLTNNVWSELKMEPRPPARSGHSAVIFQNSMYIYGGRYQNQQYFNDIWAFDFKLLSWRLISPSGDLPPPTYNQSSVVYRDSLYIFGGYGSDDVSGKKGTVGKFVSGHRHGKLFEYSFYANKWHMVRTSDAASPTARLGHTMHMVGDQLLLFGGWDRNGYRNDMFSIDHDALVFDLKKMMHDEATSDLAFSIDDGSPAIAAHIPILAARCPALLPAVRAAMRDPRRVYHLSLAEVLECPANLILSQASSTSSSTSSSSTSSITVTNSIPTSTSTTNVSNSTISNQNVNASVSSNATPSCTNPSSLTPTSTSTSPPSPSPSTPTASSSSPPRSSSLPSSILSTLVQPSSSNSSNSSTSSNPTTTPPPPSSSSSSSTLSPSLSPPRFSSPPKPASTTSPPSKKPSSSIPLLPSPPSSSSSSSSPPHKITISLSHLDINRTVLRQLLSYLYTGTMPYNHTVVAQLWHLAERLHLPECAQLCRLQIQQYLVPQHVLPIFSAADLFGLSQAKLICRRFIRDHYEAVTVLPDVRQLSQELLIEMMRIPTKQFGPTPAEETQLPPISDPTSFSSSSAAAPPPLKRDLRALFKSPEFGEFADVCLLVNERPFWVHKSIMIARNPVFAQMFNSRMQESKSRTISFSDISERAFERLLEFLYCGSHGFETLSFDESVELLVLADRFLLSGLKEFCGTRIRESLTAENALHVLSVADRTGLVGLRLDALSMISSHFYALAANPDLYDLSSDLLVQIIQSHCAHCPTFRYLSPDAQHAKPNNNARPGRPHRHGGSLIMTHHTPITQGGGGAEDGHAAVPPASDAIPIPAHEFEPNEADIMIETYSTADLSGFTTSPPDYGSNHHHLMRAAHPASSTSSTSSSTFSTASIATASSNATSHAMSHSSSSSHATPPFSSSHGMYANTSPHGSHQTLPMPVPAFRSRSDTLRNCLTIHFPEYQQFQGAFMRYESDTSIQDILDKVTKKRNLVATDHQVRIFKPEGEGTLSPPSSPPLYPNILVSLDARVAEVGSTDLYVVKKDGEFSRY